MRRMPRMLAVAVLLAAASAACGVPQDGGPHAVPDKNVPFGLLDPGTSTTAPPAR
jgi:hypothetical protein